MSPVNLGETDVIDAVPISVRELVLRDVFPPQHFRITSVLHANDSSVSPRIVQKGMESIQTLVSIRFLADAIAFARSNGNSKA